jgi:uncharacterized membrane protein
VKWRFHISPGSISAFNIDTSPGSFLILNFRMSACQRFSFSTLVFAFCFLLSYLPWKLVSDKFSA